jgi:hypothetical protein
VWYNRENSIKGGLKLRPRIFFPIIISFLIGLLLIGGCATTGKFKEPRKAESTLLIGRIKLICSDFPREWHINGEHTKGLRVYFVDVRTRNVERVISKGKDGVFYLVNPTAERYYLYGFEIRKRAGNMTFSDYYLLENIYIDITKDRVNNLADIIWYETFTEETKTGVGHSTFTKKGSHEFVSNYEQVQSWFKTEYAGSRWNSKKWVSVVYSQR